MVELFAPVEIAVVGRAGLGQQQPEGIVGVGIGDGLGAVGQGARAAEAVGMVVADHAVAGLAQEVVPVDITRPQAARAVAFFQ